MKHSFRKSHDHSDIVVSRVVEDFTSNKFVGTRESNDDNNTSFTKVAAVV